MKTRIATVLALVVVGAGFGPLTMADPVMLAQGPALSVAPDVYITFDDDPVPGSYAFDNQANPGAGQDLSYDTADVPTYGAPYGKVGVGLRQRNDAAPRAQIDSFAPLSSVRSVAVFGWVKWSTMSYAPILSFLTYGTGFSTAASRGTSNGLIMEPHPLGYLSTYALNGGVEVGAEGAGAGSVTTGQWYHVGWRYDETNGTITLFLDGAKQVIDDVSGDYGTTGTAFNFTYSSATYPNLIDVDEVAIFVDDIPSDADVVAMRQAGLNGEHLSW